MADISARDSQVLVDELTAACNSLGKLDINDGVYMKDRECKACLKEIIRILNIDTSQRVVRITLGKLNIVKADLIPIIVQYCDFNDGDQDLFKLILKLATNITSSVLILFPELPTEPVAIKAQHQVLEGLQNYKGAFAEDPKVWHTLNTYLRHFDDDETLFERVLILIRNILHIPVDVSADMGVKTGYNFHELCINHMSQSGMLSTLIYLASETTKGTEFCFHIIEIVYLVLRNQNPVTVASSSEPGGTKRKLEADDHDKRVLVELMKKEKMRREVEERNFRVPRFKNACFAAANLTGLGDRPIVTRGIVRKREEISFDVNKTQLRKAKNKKPLSSATGSSFHSDENNATSRISSRLKLFSKIFVEKVYANYMQQIKYNLMQKKAAEHDETYYLWAIQYFMPFSRHLHLDLNHIKETLATSSIHFIQVLIADYQDKLKLEKKRSEYEKISQRLHLAVRAYKEILATYQFIKPDSPLHSSVDATKKTIFSEIEYNTLILSLFKSYVSNKHSASYLRDLIKANHIYLELIEEYHKSIEDPVKTSFFVSSYCIPEILGAYTEVLRDFRTNETAINLNVLKFFERVVNDCKNETMFMQASLLRVLLDINDYHQSLPGYHGFVAIIKQVMTSFGQMIHKKRWMMQELLFWKTRNDVIEIENAVDPPMQPVAESPKRTDDLDFELNFSPDLDDKENGQDDGVTQREEQPADSLEDLMDDLASESSFNSDIDDLDFLKDDDGVISKPTPDEAVAVEKSPQPPGATVAGESNGNAVATSVNNNDGGTHTAATAALAKDGDGDDDDDDDDDDELLTSLPRTAPSPVLNRLDSDSESDDRNDGGGEKEVGPNRKSLLLSDSDGDLSSPPSPLPSPDLNEDAPELSDIPAINEDSE